METEEQHDGCGLDFTADALDDDATERLLAGLEAEELKSNG